MFGKKANIKSHVDKKKKHQKIWLKKNRKISSKISTICKALEKVEKKKEKLTKTIEKQKSIKQQLKEDCRKIRKSFR